MQVKTVGIVGYGAFGTLVHTLLNRFVPEIAVRIHTHDKKPDGKLLFSLAETAKSDAVILAVPIAAFEGVLREVLPLTRKDTVIVDVSTVKVHTRNLLKKLAKGRRYVSTHPVWGPESYEKRGGDVAGFRIVVAAHTLPKGEARELFEFLRKFGFDVVEMSAESHDKHLAETLFLTHFVGQLITKAGFGRTEIDTVSYGFLMDAVESVRHDEKLFRDVFRFNPYCTEVLKRIEKAEGDVRRFLEGGEASGKNTSIVIGISGAKGSFSEEAARAYVKRNKIKKFSLEYLISVENVLSALEKGVIGLAIFPIENSTGGVVTEAVQGMARHNFTLKKMFDIDIRQNLLVQKGIKARDVKTITSHEQALRQCKGYLKKNWQGTKVKDYEDTAKAEFTRNSTTEFPDIIRCFQPARCFLVEIPKFLQLPVFLFR